MTNPTRYLSTCFWLWVPPMAISFAFAARLGPAYQPDIFWDGIPPALGLTEHVSRVAMIAISTFMIIGLSSRQQRTGWAFFLLGMILYAASYAAQIRAPDSNWSQSVWGFAAPAFTTALWIYAIGLIGQHSFFPKSRWLRPLYFATATLFIGAHVAHTVIIHARLG